MRAETQKNALIKFCDFAKMSIANATEMKIDRVHRLGRFERGKRRPIVAKFNFYGDKVKVKDTARDKLNSNSGPRVGDQLPKPIQERRKKLIPYLVEARQNGRQASLAYDTLYIDNVRYTHDRPPPGPVPELPPRGRRDYGTQRRDNPGSSKVDGNQQGRRAEAANISIMECSRTYF